MPENISFPIFLVVALVLVILTAFVSWTLAIAHRKKIVEAKIGSAEEKSREIIDEALKTAETKKREALLEAKEESLKTKNELEKETKERRAELQRYEKRVLTKEETLDRKTEALEKKESKLAIKESELEKVRTEVESLHEKQTHELEKISGLTSEQAKDYLLKTVEDEVKHETAKLVKELENRAKEEADKKAKDYVVTAIQRCAADHVAETTISVVQLPNDEMKGRIIGREGRNIRTLETLTGVDLIIDDTPEAVILSGFDPIRREVARIALEKLIVDGRIHPARIEEMVEKAQKEVEVMIREEGEAATLEVGVHGIHPELVKLLGRMKFRTSYGQNALKHSIEVAHLSGLLAGEIGVDVRMAKRAGLLHDIGKSVDHDMEGSHIQIGVDLCRKYKESPIVINAVESHHGDVEPESLIACIVQAADTISAARPGARRETLETYTNRLKQLEDITTSFKGVDKSFAIQAGREVRVMVLPEQISDDDMVLLARDVSKQIEAELEYPGQIKVNVIRESRCTDYAK
ncbi:MAG: ribonuclease Y [bacterium]|nr:ribonuclease Y [bacterium]